MLIPNRQSDRVPNPIDGMSYDISFEAGMRLPDGQLASINYTPKWKPFSAVERPPVRLHRPTSDIQAL